MDWPEKLRLLTRGRYGAKSDLHRKTGIPLRSISRWIKGGKLPRSELRVVGKLAKALGVDEAWFRDPASELPALPRSAASTDLVRAATASAGTEYEPIFRALAAPDLVPEVAAFCRYLLSRGPSARAPHPTRASTKP